MLRPKIQNVEHMEHYVLIFKAFKAFDINEEIY